MTASEAVLLVIGVAGVVFGTLAILRSMEKRNARRLAGSLLGRACPACGGIFNARAVRDAREEHGLGRGATHVSVVCSGCAKRWRFLDGQLSEAYRDINPDQRSDGVNRRQPSFLARPLASPTLFQCCGISSAVR